MAFHGLVEPPDRSGCVASDPSGSRRSSRRCAESTTSSRPSGRKSMHIGNDATVTTTSWLPSVPSAITWFAPQSETQSRPPCRGGASPTTPPPISTSPAPTWSLLLADRLGKADRAGPHRTPPAPPWPPPESAPPPPPWPAPAGHLARLETGQLHRPTGHRGARGQRSTRSPARRESPNAHGALHPRIHHHQPRRGAHRADPPEHRRDPRGGSGGAVHPDRRGGPPAPRGVPPQGAGGSRFSPPGSPPPTPGPQNPPPGGGP